MPVQTQVQMRRDTAANWTSTNPTLASGEWGLETDTRLMKIGDGTTAWNSLSYQLGPLLDQAIPIDPNSAYFDGTGYYSNGVQGSLTTPDSAALDITGDIDIAIKMAATDWTPSASASIISKRASNFAYVVNLLSSGKLRLSWSTDGGTGAGLRNVESSVVTGLTDGSTKWIRVTLDVDNGASGYDVKFYLSDDGSSWTQLGTTITGVGTTSIFSSGDVLRIGGFNSGQELFNGYLYKAIIKNGIGGTTVFDANFEAVPSNSFAFSESSSNAAVVTLDTNRYAFGLPAQYINNAEPRVTSANRTWYVPFSVTGKPINLTHLALESTTAPATNSTVRIGIYKADSQLQPTGNIIFESGAITVVSGSAAMYRVRVTPQTLQAGNYLIAFNSSVSFTARTYLGNNVSFSFNFSNNGVIVDGYYVAATLSGAALPTTGTKWNTRNYFSNGFKNWILLGWS